MDDKRFVFVCGLHKSGTTLLFELLRDHPEISGFRETGVARDEGQHLQSVYLPAKAYGGFGRFAFDPRSYLDENSQLATEANAQKLFDEWSRHWNQDAPILLEKSPPNLVRTRFLQQLFPNSWFIVILRHPLAVAYSTQKISKTPLYSLLEHWLVGYERFYQDKNRLKRVYVMRYEELVSSPDDVMNDVYNFLGVRSAPISKDIDNRNYERLSRWQALQRQLPGRLYARWLVRRYEGRFSRFGYSLACPHDLMPICIE